MLQSLVFFLYEIFKCITQSIMSTHKETYDALIRPNRSNMFSLIFFVNPLGGLEISISTHWEMYRYVYPLVDISREELTLANSMKIAGENVLTKR